MGHTRNRKQRRAAAKPAALTASQERKGKDRGGEGKGRRQEDVGLRDSGWMVGWMEQSLTPHSTQYRSFRRRSSQPIT